MKLVFLTAHSEHGEPQHRYVAQEIAKAFPDELAAIIVATGVPRTPLTRARRLLRRYTLRELVSRFAVRIEHRLRGRAVRRDAVFNRIFFPQGGGERMPPGDRLITVRAHNSAECRRILDEIAPDVIMTYGTLILRPDLIAKSRVSTINMHTGISPRYRGSDTIFWPLYYQQPEWIGATVHRVDPGIDTGAILHIVRPDIAPDDDFDSLFAKTVKAATPYFIQAAREEMAGTSAAVPQDLSKGREFRSVQRTLAAERKVRALLKGGLLRRASEGAGAHVPA